MYKMSQKLIASILVTIIMLAECSLIGIYGGKVYAEDSGFETQKTKINNADAEFDAYFMDEETKNHISRKQIENENSIYISLNVNSGYIKNAQVKFEADNGQEPANFKIERNVENVSVQEIDVANSIVKLNQINTGNAKIIEIPIHFNYSEKILPSEFARTVIAKLTGTYVDNEGKEKTIEKEIYTYLIWKADINEKGYLRETISKFIPYEVGEQKGVIVEETINTKVEGNPYPTKSTNIEIEVPTINDIKPTSVKVYASLEATNGDVNGTNFTHENYTYNQEENKLTITVENKEDTEGKVVWKKDVVDEYKIIYIYPETAKQVVDEEGTTLTRKIKSVINLYAAGEAKTTNTSEKEENFKNKVGTITNYSVEGKTQSIGKGTIYANYVAENKTDVDYEENWVAEVVAPQLVDKIVFESQNDKVFKGENEIATLNDTIYKYVYIDKQNFYKMLGEEGEIKLYSDNNLILTINKEYIENAPNDEILIYGAQYRSNNIKIETSKPQSEGKLTFRVVKSIQGQLSVTKAQFEQVDTLKETIKAYSHSGENVLEQKTLENVITFTEPETKASIAINNENLSTVLKNENVELTAILNTDSLNNRLYKNPSLTIELPKYIEEVEIKDAKILFDTELKISNTNVVNNANGGKSIVVTLTGEQTKYSVGSLTGGANVVITLDLTVNKLTSNRTENITMTYTNANDQGSKQAVASVNFVAPVGVITTSSIENYAEGKAKLTSMSGVNAVAELDILKDAVDAKFDMSVINNYNNIISNINILGRIPSKTFDLKLKSPVAVSGVDASKVKVYYSTNKDADRDLTKEANDWKLEVENYETVKSYLIVVEGSLNTAEAVNFGYTAEIPANLNYNEEAIESYVAYFTNNLETGAIQDKEESTPITITTGKGPIIETSIKSNIEQESTVLSGNVIKYTITVGNAGTKPATNTKLTFNIPENTKYIEYTDINKNEYTVKPDEKLEYEIGSLEVASAIKKEIYVEVQRTATGNEEFVVTAKAVVTADEFEKAIETNNVTNNAKNSIYTIDIYKQQDIITESQEGEKYEYAFYVSLQNSLAKVENNVLETKIPEGLTFKEVKVQNYKMLSGEAEDIDASSNYNSENRILSVNLGTIGNGKSKKIIITTTVDNLPENEYSKNIKIQGTVKSEGIEEASYEKTDRIVKEGLEITQTANIPTGSKISKDEQIVYTVNLKNIGSKAILVNVKDVLPNELLFQTLEYELNGNKMNYSTSVDNTVEYSFYVAEGETKVIKIKAVALEVENDTEITNVITASTEKISNVESNTITYIIEKSKYTDETPEENPEQQGEPKTALVRLGGVVWKDTNKNGIKEAGEDFLEDVEVVLLDTKTNKLFEQNEKIVKVRTDANGIYAFENVPSGNYIVIFLYDTAKYSATLYKQTEADEYTDSDALDTKIKLNGNDTIAGVTDIIKLEDANLYNIDLGLVDNPKFDLKLDMQISKITVQNADETKVYEYENTNLAKLEFAEKYLNNSTIVVEYTIKVTNQGAVEGYVKKIADYLPKELSFNSELNRDWYENENGIVYNASLANTKILPGETKEVKLLLTKVINENSLGTINNNAEIYEAYNDKGYIDTDSTPANNNSSEDDYTSADLVLSIKTGKMVMFVGLTLTIITIIGTSAYFIKKKVLR